MVETPEADDVTEDDFVIASYVGDSGLEMNDTHATRGVVTGNLINDFIHSFIYLFAHFTTQWTPSLTQSITHSPTHLSISKMKTQNGVIWQHHALPSFLNTKTQLMQLMLFLRQS